MKRRDFVQTMGAVAAAINDPENGLQSCVEEWERRRDLIVEESWRGVYAGEPHTEGLGFPLDERIQESSREDWTVG